MKRRIIVIEKKKKETVNNNIKIISNRKIKKIKENQLYQ